MSPLIIFCHWYAYSCTAANVTQNSSWWWRFMIYHGCQCLWWWCKCLCRQRHKHDGPCNRGDKMGGRGDLAQNYVFFCLISGLEICVWCVGLMSWGRSLLLWARGSILVSILAHIHFLGFTVMDWFWYLPKKISLSCNKRIDTIKDWKKWQLFNRHDQQASQCPIGKCGPTPFFSHISSYYRAIVSQPASPPCQIGPCCSHRARSIQPPKSLNISRSVHPSCLCTEGASPCHRGSLLLPSSVKFNTIISRILGLNGCSVGLVNTIGLCVPANMIAHSIAISLPAPFLEIHTLFTAHCYCHVFL